MKKILLLCCFLIGITTISRAQDYSNKSPEEKAKILQKTLQLSDDQTARITSIYKEDQYPTSYGSRQTIDSKIKAVLTSEQAISYDKFLFGVTIITHTQDSSNTTPEEKAK